MIRLRPMQEKILEYQGGSMGISAVPGSGKTFTLSLLAARLLAERMIEEEQEILIVTLVNSAVENFRQRIGGFVREMGLLPNIGYRVRTLHGLAHDIVRERPSLVGLSDGFQIVDDQEATRMRNRVVDAWLKANPGRVIDSLLTPEVLENKGKAESVRRNEWPRLAQDVVAQVIGRAKDLRLSAADLTPRLANEISLPLLEMAVAVYRDYERALSFRGAVDFSDLIRLAIDALEADHGLLERLQDRWPFVLEDEAQDSSTLQEEILRRLASDNGNWVRVGDPNQAIFETFTTASPEHFLNFLKTARYRMELPNSGRSTQSIIDLANYFIGWVRSEHPVVELRQSLAEPLILPAPPGDPQPNPPAKETIIEFIDQDFDEDREIAWVADHLAAWLPANPDRTVAVLVRTNEHGGKVATALGDRDLPCIELLRTTTPTRKTTGALTYFLAHLADPTSPKTLADAYKVFRRGEAEEETQAVAVSRGQRLLQKLQRTEEFLAPAPGNDWLESLPPEDGRLAADLEEFKRQLRRWHAAAMLPVDQLVLTIAQDFFREPPELALAQKLASLLAEAGDSNPDWRLPEFRHELVQIANNMRSFIGFSDEDLAFDPDKQKGKVVVATYHKAKGLEWDRVYLMQASNAFFPSAHPEDPYFSQRYYIRDGLDVGAEAQAQLYMIMDDDPFGGFDEGSATRKARLDNGAESLRTFYVGITRARRQLIVTYNTGRKGKNGPSVPFTVLKTYEEERRNGAPR
ncbi:MAG: ATP-dependent helicase [Anaerolineales bacterium]|jgi:DNA helicase-2/ATP-dependent DNA helicase PcrA